MTTLQPLWTRKHATARKVRQRISTVMRWAIAQGYLNDNPAGDAVTAALPKRPAPGEHRRAIPHGEVAAALATVRNSGAWAGLKLAFEFLVLTAMRSTEVRLSTWGEIDLAARTWTVPAARMKAKAGDHRGGAAARAYARSDLFERRRTLMDEWRAYLAGGFGGGRRAPARSRRRTPDGAGIAPPGRAGRSI